MKSVEVLIVDEAAQAVEPEVLIPLALNPKRCGKRAFFEPHSFMSKRSIYMSHIHLCPNDQFTKTGSGQTQEKLREEVFLCRLLLAGDPQQLGATLHSMAAERAGLGRPLLAR
jgi:hypothetical protein